jgi:hypothetical protein
MAPYSYLVTRMGAKLGEEEDIFRDILILSFGIFSRGAIWFLIRNSKP